MVSVGVGEENGINSMEFRRERLDAEVGRGIDEDALSGITKDDR